MCASSSEVVQLYLNTWSTISSVELWSRATEQHFPYHLPLQPSVARVTSWDWQPQRPRLLPWLLNFNISEKLGSIQSPPTVSSYTLLWISNIGTVSNLWILTLTKHNLCKNTVAYICHAMWRLLMRIINLLAGRTCKTPCTAKPQHCATLFAISFISKS